MLRVLKITKIQVSAQEVLQFQHEEIQHIEHVEKRELSSEFIYTVPAHYFHSDHLSVSS